VAHLKLGPLPKQNAVPVTIVLSEPLKEELNAYATEHSRLYEPIETTALIPRMLLAFLRTNRAGRPAGMPGQACNRWKQRGARANSSS
jgi:hypothetical protein